MQFKVTTKNGHTYEVNDDSVWLWVSLEKDLGLTYNQAIAKLQDQSLDVVTYILYHESRANGQTQLKTRQAWLETEFAEFDVVDADPKD